MDQHRSFLRTREAWFRKHPIDDAHVKIYKKLRTKLENEVKRNSRMWTCPACGGSVLFINRHRDSDGHLSKHCGCSASKTKSMSPEQLAEHKRQVMIERKRKYRREAGCMLRSDMAARAEAKRAEVEKKRELKPKLHDAHVKRYLSIMYSRAKYAARYQSNPQAEIDRQKRRKLALPDSYVIQNIVSMGVPMESVTPPLIAIKREAMQYRRMFRTIKTAIKNYWKAENETITKHA